MTDSVIDPHGVGRMLGRVEEWLTSLLAQARREGAEAMRERCAKVCADGAAGFVWRDGSGRMEREGVILTEAAGKIHDLPLEPGDAPEGEPDARCPDCGGRGRIADAPCARCCGGAR